METGHHASLTGSKESTAFGQTAVEVVAREQDATGGRGERMRTERRVIRLGLGAKFTLTVLTILACTMAAKISS